MWIDRVALEETYARARVSLLASRNVAGHWDDGPARSAGASPSPRRRLATFFRPTAGEPENATSACKTTCLAVAALAATEAPQAAPQIKSLVDAATLSREDLSRVRAFLLSRLATNSVSSAETADALFALRVVRDEGLIQPRRPASPNADTAEPLRALRETYDADATVRAAAAEGVRRLVEAQQPDGSIGSLSTTADAIRSLCAWAVELDQPLRQGVHDGSLRAISFLVRSQFLDGSWGASIGPDLAMTTRVLRVAAFAIPLKDGLPLDWPQALWRGVRHLLDAQHDDGGWEPSVATTAAALSALARVVAHDQAVRANIDTERDDHWTVFHKMDEVLIDGEQDEALLRDAIGRSVAWLVERTNRGTTFADVATNAITVDALGLALACR